MSLPICPNCKRQTLLPDARFCGKCGAYLAAESPSKSEVWRHFWRVGRAILMLCGIAGIAGATIFSVVQHEEKSEITSESSSTSNPALYRQLTVVVNRAASKQHHESGDNFGSARC